MRRSVLHAPTLREIPAEAEIPSHRLMLQAGLIRRSAAGTYSWLPLGLRTLHKMATIVREEMDRAGAQEILMPVLQPAELWRESGRWDDYGAELFRLTDRHERWFTLGPTHEEIITDLVRGELRSYRQLPVCLYQIQTKFRDEVRPRFGVMRSREFLMKDAYSFDRDEAGLDEAYNRMKRAYERIFARAGLDARPALADSGAIGGDSTHEFVVPSEYGESRVVSCDVCGYLANVERAAVGVAPAGPGPDSVLEPAVPAPGPHKVETPGMHTVEKVAGFLGIDSAHLVKTMIVVCPSGETAAALVRGDHELSATKLARALGSAGVELAGPELVERVTGAPVGYAGPSGLRGLRIVADPAVVALASAVTGANEGDAHLVGVVPGRDFHWDVVADIREVGHGDPCPNCGAPMQAWRGIEVGQIFKLGTKYSQSFGAVYADEAGELRPLVMGCYGIGVGRTVAASVEGSCDAQGIAWPVALAPYHVYLLAVNERDPAQSEAAAALYEQLQESGIEVLWDDRAERAGVKFKDADLIGLPLRLTIGPRTLAAGNVELRERASGLDALVPLTGVVEAVKAALQRLTEATGRGRAGRAGQ